MFRIMEHTADLVIEADGADAGEALAWAGQALACIATGREDLHGLRPDGELAFTVKAPDRDALAVAFLCELLWFLESESALWLGGGARVEETDEGWVAHAEGNAVMYDPAKHGQGTEVKAITYHDLAFGPKGRSWQLHVVVDI